MASKLKLKNAENAEFEITHNDGDGAISISGSDLENSASVNVDNIANNTIPTSDPLVAGRIWNDSGILKVSTGA